MRLLWACLALTLCACGQTPPAFRYEIHAHSNVGPDAVVLAGQSNMSNYDVHGLTHRFADEWALQIDPAAPVIIQCAVGGTSLLDWNPGGRWFEACIEATNGYHVVGMFWYQGEADAGTRHYPDYVGRFQNLIRTFRAYFSQVPLVYAQLATHTDYRPYWEEIQAAQANADVPDSAMIETASWVTLENDSDTGLPSVHLDSASHIELARRMVGSMGGLL